MGPSKDGTKIGNWHFAHSHLFPWCTLIWGQYPGLLIRLCSIFCNVVEGLQYCASICSTYPITFLKPLANVWDLCLNCVVFLQLKWRSGYWLLIFSTYPRINLAPYAGFRLACRSPLCRVIIACCFRVATLSGNAALALSPSGIAPELNRIQLSAICRGGQSGKVIDLLAWRCLPLGHPSAASDACAVELISSSKRQCGKLVWNQH